MKSILLVVDVQKDFAYKAGSLYVDGGLEIVPFINELLHRPYDLKIGTQDWHPYGHCSFASTHKKPAFTKIENDILWPDHCIKNEFGSQFVDELESGLFDIIIRKGTKQELDSYSAFLENDRKTPTYLGNIVEQGDKIDIVGIATDVCVGWTAIHALNYTNNVNVILQGCAGVEKTAIDRAIEVMRNHKINIE
jgi:nicotinamidase/pyrazinamidase